MLLLLPGLLISVSKIRNLGYKRTKNNYYVAQFVEGQIHIESMGNHLIVLFKISSNFALLYKSKRTLTKDTFLKNKPKRRRKSSQGYEKKQHQLQQRTKTLLSHLQKAININATKNH